MHQLVLLETLIQEVRHIYDLCHLIELFFPFLRTPGTRLNPVSVQLTQVLKQIRV